MSIRNYLPCYMSLRTGTIIIGFLSTIGGIYFLVKAASHISSSYELLKNPSNEFKQTALVPVLGMIWVADDNFDNLHASVGVQTRVLDFVVAMTGFIFIIYLTINCLLIYGAWTSQKGFLLPWMACEFVGNIVEVLLIITYYWLFTYFEVDEEERKHGPYWFTNFKVVPLALILGFVFLLIVYNHFEELLDKENPATSDTTTTVLCDRVFDVPDLGAQTHLPPFEFARK